MCSTTWTPDALSSEFRPYAGTVWRVVEAQHVISTCKLVDTLDEQSLLERMLEKSKPPVPEDCKHLHYLLYTPFRYAPPMPGGSRFRRAGQREGVFYAAEALSTALAEIAFHRLLFFLDSPDTPLPRQAIAMTGFSISLKTEAAIDLTVPPFVAHADLWRHPVDYSHCQALADSARSAGAELIRYGSVRDPEGGFCVAVLACRAFAENRPAEMRTLHMLVNAQGVEFLQDFPRQSWRFAKTVFSGDPRLAKRS